MIFLFHKNDFSEIIFKTLSILMKVGVMVNTKCHWVEGYKVLILGVCEGVAKGD